MRVILRTGKWDLTFRLVKNVAPYRHAWRSSTMYKAGVRYKIYHRDYRFLFVSMMISTIEERNYGTSQAKKA